MRVLDIGCGPGSVTDGLTEFVATEGFVLGVDAATDVLEMANSGETQANFVAADARRVGDWWTSYLSQAPLVDHADALGLATRDELADLASAWREWGSSPAAFSARLWCAAVGWKGDAA